MGKIIVYNSKNEDHTNDPNNFYIGRPSPLGNPFTHNGKHSSLAKLSFKTREEAINAYSAYFDEVYGKDPKLTIAFDEIYEHYKKGEDIYLQCFCKPLKCHGDILAEKLQEKLIKEQIKKTNDEK